MRRTVTDGPATFMVVMGSLIVGCDAPLKPFDSPTPPAAGEATGAIERDPTSQPPPIEDHEELFTPSAPTRDEVAPFWPAEAELGFEYQLEEIVVTWPSATDDGGEVTAYSVYLDERMIVRLGPDERRYVLPHLTAGSHLVKVIASDAAHNRSEPLVGQPDSDQYAPRDQESPAWSEGARAIVSDITATAATVRWTHASDDIGVVAYELRVSRDSAETEVIRVEVNTEPSTESTESSAQISAQISAQHRLLELAPSTAYTITITALDGSGASSETSLSVDLETLSEGGPTWAADSTLTAIQSGATEVTLTWPAAQDDSGTVRYRVEEEGAVVAHVDEPTWSQADLGTPKTYHYAIWAVDERSVTSDAPLEATLEASDQSSPVWPEGASLRVISTRGDRVTLRWDEARDNHRVAHYLVSWGDQARQVETPAITINGLSAAAEHTIRVTALDASGNETADALTANVTTTDEQAPTWPTDAALTLTWIEYESSDATLEVQWPPAQDNVGIVRYTITRNTAAPEQLGDVTTHHYVGLAAELDHIVRVVAYDASGHRTAQALQGTARRASADAPEWPAGAALLASNLTETGVRLAWPPASLPSSTPGSTLSGSLVYTLQCSEQDPITGQAINQVVNQTTELTMFTVSDLEPWTDYLCMVSAQDATGRRAATDLTTRVKTLDVTPPIFPHSEALRAVEIGERVVVLRWSAATDNVAVTSYELSVNNAEPQTLNTSSLLWRLEDLVPWSAYTLRLYAVDAAGNRTAAPALLSFQTADLTAPWWPDAATLSVEELTSTGVTLSWPEAQDNVGVSAYRVQIGDAGPSSEPSSLSADSASVHVDDLTPGQRYQFAIYAQDAAGQVSLALETEVTTPDNQAPTWPSGAALIPSQIEATSLTVAWPEAIDNAGVTGYRVYADGLLFGEVPGDLLNFRLESLGAAQLVLVEVTAIDAAGNESARLMLSIQTVDGGPPTWGDASLQWQSGLNHISLSWPPAQDDVAVTGYRVIVNGEMKLETAERSALLEGLTRGQRYTVHIEAGDAANHWSEGGPSAEIQTVERAYEGFTRLSKLEYTRAVAHLVQGLYGTDEDPRLYCDVSRASTRASYCGNAPNGFDAWVNVVSDLLKAYPEEIALRGEHELGGGFERLDQRLFDEHIGVWTSVAGTLTETYFNSGDARLTGAYPWSTPNGAAPLVQWSRCQDELGPYDEYAEGLIAYTRACFSHFVERFGARATRRPLTDVERDEFMGYFDAVPDQLPERFEVERQLRCWLEVNQPRWANPVPRPWDWTTDDEDWCAQVDEERLEAMHPYVLHLERAMVDLMPVLLTRPEFVYHIELGDESGALTAHELANRLSFHFWRAPPDQALRDLADSGALLDEEVYAAQVDRLFNDPRAEESVRTFYQGYFWIDSVPSLIEAGPGRYLAETDNSHPYDIRGFSNQWFFALTFLRDAAQDELSNLGHYFTRERPGSYQEMFTSNLNFLECQSGGSYPGCGGAGPFGMFVYKTGNCSDYRDCEERRWLPETETGYIRGDVPVEIPEPNRYGLITRIGFLLHDTVKQRPIRRGLKIRDMLLCDPIPPPENCDVVRVPNLTGICAQDGVQTGRECSHNSHCEEGQICEDPFRKNNLTVREVVEEITEQEGTSCATCHARWINGMGHALSNYSSQGLYRTHEPLYLAENRWSWGRHVLSTTLRPQDEWPPYDVQGEFQFEGQQYSVNGAEELANFLSDSGRLESCWAQQYFRYTMGRLETPSDRPVIESLADQLRSGASLAEVFKGIAFTSAFTSISKPSSQRSSEDSSGDTP